jgi:hypothetical protein
MAEALAVADAGDVWLAPHSDDICFSLGLTAFRRRCGTLLTAFPLSGYHAGLPRAQQGAEALTVTRLRLAEDAAFARACGLAVACLEFEDAALTGWPPFDAGRTHEQAARVEGALLAALRGPAVGRAPQLRPWLFCPAGIGGHVDHLALRAVVARHFDALRALYRIAFYEDLHYASDAAARTAGLEIGRASCRERVS